MCLILSIDLLKELECIMKWLLFLVINWPETDSYTASTFIIRSRDLLLPEVKIMASFAKHR